MTTITAYSSRATNWPVLIVAAGLALPMAALSRPDSAPASVGVPLASILILVAIVGIAVLTATSLRVAVGGEGVVVRLGILGVPTFRYDLAEIASARAVTISRWATPGIFWTHRDGLRLALHGGSAIHLVLRSGRRVTVGVANARAALDALAQAGLTDVDSGD